ncbi:hypothetical protein [Fimbriimonas ginsengisoli]|uniref:Uncharacterized protein n=1 Tax=Fimbriimonas ginsengisoli Gsoil 348 TaxID=661478 RepID=A0A068NQE8_FIMGI|nr:hypothetical protein [Fimbriimonas ginsengisoli]AIE85793.1 hypothetical protein OP10G_2425 [Fimbriimonas ginsengisoli Gsoil 348]
MNFRIALTSLAAFATFATALADPGILTLVSDSGDLTGVSVIHRIDSETGAYQGSIGGLYLNHAGAIACSTEYYNVKTVNKRVYVADDTGIKNFNVATGMYNGMIPYNGQGKAIAMCFGTCRVTAGNDYLSDPDLLVVFQTDALHYKLRRYDALTGALLTESAPVTALLTGPVSISCSLGDIDVMYGAGATSCDDIFSGNTVHLTKPVLTSHTAIYAMDTGDYRSSMGPFLRVLGNGELRSGIGHLNGGIHLGWLAPGKYVGTISGSEFHRTEVITNVNSMLVTLTGFYAAGSYISQSTYPLYAAFKHGTLRGIAHYGDPKLYNVW